MPYVGLSWSVFSLENVRGFTDCRPPTVELIDESSQTVYFHVVTHIKIINLENVKSLSNGARPQSLRQPPKVPSNMKVGLGHNMRRNRSHLASGLNPAYPPRVFVMRNVWNVQGDNSVQGCTYNGTGAAGAS